MAWASEPSCQKVIWVTCALSAKKMNRPMSAPAKAFTAIPVRISVTTSVRPPERDIAYTRSTVASPATNAQTVTVQLPRKVRPSAIAPTAPTAAPAEMPMTPGSASGLPNTPCIRAPAQPSEAPTRTARTTRGSRMFHRTLSAVRSSACPPSPIR